MTSMVPMIKLLFAGFTLNCLVLSSAISQADDGLDDLFNALREADATAAAAIEGRIWEEWSKSGSASMDLLLERGREALENEDAKRAIEHFSALIDHAPDFAEGYNARASAYFREGLYGPSLEDIRRALELNPRHFGALSGLGIIFESIGHPEDALEAYRAVSELYPAQDGLQDRIDRLSRELDGEKI